MEANVFYFTSVTSAYVQFCKLKPDKATGLLSNVARTIAAGSDSEFTQVHCAVGTSFKRIIQNCISNPAIQLALNEKIRSFHAQGSGSPLLNFIGVVEGLIELKFQHTWVYTLDTVRALLDRMTGDSCNLLFGIIDKLLCLYDAIFAQTIDVAAVNQVYVFDAVGHALRSVGVARFLQLTKWFEPRRCPPFCASRDWVINLLQTNLRLMPCKLMDFVDVILPMARRCDSIANSSDTDENVKKNMKGKVSQLWSLLPGFCYFGPEDIAIAFPKLAPSFERGLLDTAYPELSASIILSITNLVRCVKNKNQGHTDLNTIFNFLPTLFSSVLTLIESLELSDYRYNNTLECVQSLASISPPQLVSAASRKLIEKLLNSTDRQEENDDTSGWLSVLLALIPYIKEGMVVIIYRAVRPILAIKESAQKRAYLVFDALLKYHGTVIETYEPKLQILSSITQYLLTCGVNARHMRLRCISTLLSSIDNDDDILRACDSMLSEILICLKDCNKKSRTSAVEVLDILISRTPLEFLVSRLNSALTVDNGHIRSSAINAFCLLILSRRFDSQMLRYADDHLPQILSQLEDETGELTRAVLSYIRVCVSVLPVDILEGLAPEILDAITRCVGPLKQKFIAVVRAIVRKLVKRVPEVTLRQHMYDDDVPLLDYILKQDRRSKRKKEASQKDRIEEMLGSDTDSDSESGEEPELRQRKRVKAVRASYDYNATSLTINAYLDRQCSPENPVNVNGQQTSSSDEDSEYRVVVDESGRVVVQQISLAPRSKPEAEAVVSHPEAQKSQTQSKKRMREPGEEYRSKKAGGDVWRRGQLEPHAYIPLDPRILTKKNQRSALTQFGAVMTNRNKGKMLLKERNRNVKVSRNQRLAMRKHAKRNSDKSH